MLYNIKIGKTLKKDKKGKRGLHLIIYIHVREGKERIISHIQFVYLKASRGIITKYQLYFFDTLLN